MVRFLPPEPDLDHLRHEAKALHRAYQQGDRATCDLLRHVHRFRDAADDQILAAGVPLTELQFALARDYGFASWPALRQTVLRARPAPGFAPGPDGDAALLASPPVWGGGGPDTFIGALAMALGHLEAPVDPTIVAGDSGRAFILQADDDHRPYDGDVPNLDIGWWPLDHWGAVLRLDFLSRAYGVPLTESSVDGRAYRDDPAAAYRRTFADLVESCIASGRPLVAVCDEAHLVVGHDGGDPPLLAQSWEPGKDEVGRPHVYPWCMVALGDPGELEPMDRHAIDLASLDHAVRLGRDEVDLSRLPHKSTGRRSWELWARQVADDRLCGPVYYHLNVVYHLSHHRRAAARYLRDMAGRHPGAPGADLAAAADAYDAVAQRIRDDRPNDWSFEDGDGRGRLLALIGDCVALETVGQERMARAAEAIG